MLPAKGHLSLQAIDSHLLYFEHQTRLYQALMVPDKLKTAWHLS